MTQANYIEIRHGRVIDPASGRDTSESVSCFKSFICHYIPIDDDRITLAR